MLLNSASLQAKCVFDKVLRLKTLRFSSNSLYFRFLSPFHRSAYTCTLLALTRFRQRPHSVFGLRPQIAYAIWRRAICTRSLARKLADSLRLIISRRFLLGICLPGGAAYFIRFRGSHSRRLASRLPVEPKTKNIRKRHYNE